MKKLYELNGGDTFWYGGVCWRVESFRADHRYCTPVAEDGSESHIAFHIDTEVRVDEF